jgi:hypothetical protein
MGLRSGEGGFITAAPFVVPLFVLNKPYGQKKPLPVRKAASMLWLYPKLPNPVALVYLETRIVIMTCMPPVFVRPVRNMAAAGTGTHEHQNTDKANHSIKYCGKFFHVQKIWSLNI